MLGVVFEHPGYFGRAEHGVLVGAGGVSTVVELARARSRDGLVVGIGVERLGRQEVSGAVADLGWRLILGTVRTHVVTGSLAAGAELAGRLAALPDAEGHVLLDTRDDRVVTTVRTIAAGRVLPADLGLARQITALSASLGLATRFADDPRSPQIIEIASCPARKLGLVL